MLWKVLVPASYNKLSTMTGNEILKADVLDIIFDNRNKQYGAYALRKHYNERLSTALTIAMSSILFLIFFIGSTGSKETKLNIPDDLIVRTTTIPKPEVKKPEIQQPVRQPQKAAQKEFINLTMVDHNVTPIATIKELQTSVISNTNVDEPEVPSTNIPQQTATTTGTGNVKVPEKPKEDFAPVERAPQFPGGNEAWVNFLNRNLHTPTDLEPGEKKIIRIKFEVATDGSITNFQIVQSGGSLFDNEVIRVLKKMPKWLPAIQNGKPASVSFTQPVTFMGVEE